MKIKANILVLLVLGVFYSCNMIASEKSSNSKKKENLWVAVHDFSVSENLKKDGVNGWDIAGRIENELTQNGTYKIVTRARIAKVLKEKNIKSTGSLNASNFGKMIGADFIVTGQVSLNGNKLTVVGKLVDASGETGEIEKSFDITKVIPADVSPRNYLDEMFEDIAKRLTMTPGEFLDYGLAMMDEGKYLKAVDAFREVKRIAQVEQIKAVCQKYSAYDHKISFFDRKRSPGEILDYGISSMKKQKFREAVTAFQYFSKITPYKKIKSLMQIGDLLKEAQDKAAGQKQLITETMVKASKMYMVARGKEAEKFENMSPEELCDAATVELENLLINPKIHLNEYDRQKIKGMINDIKAYRGTLFAGPVKEKCWTVQELKLKMMPVKGGFFEMGDPASTSIAESGEVVDNMIHLVTISMPFWISENEITIDQFLFYLKNPNDNSNEPDKYDRDKNINWNSKYCPIKKGYRMKRGRGLTWGKGDMPMVCVNWKAANQFCEWLTYKEQKEKKIPEGYVYRLPTEAEWEYCCKAGNKGKYGHPDMNDNTLCDYVWYEENSGGNINSVGGKKANSWGIKDMHGNVWEWCNDWHGAYLEEATDPIGADDSQDNMKVARGGSFVSSIDDLKSYVRYPVWYKSTKKNIGFRIVLAPEI